MKKLFSIMTIATIVASCGQKNQTDENSVAPNESQTTTEQVTPEVPKNDFAYPAKGEKIFRSHEEINQLIDNFGCEYEVKSGSLSNFNTSTEPITASFTQLVMGEDESECIELDPVEMTITNGKTRFFIVPDTDSEEYSTSEIEVDFSQASFGQVLIYVKKGTNEILMVRQSIAG